MPSLETMAGVLLASGLSRRFGAAKLVAALQAKPLAFWAIDAMRAAPLGRYLLVHGPHTPAPLLDYAKQAGFTLLLNPNPEQGMGTSIAAAFANIGTATHAFLALADMPFIRASDYTALAAALIADPEKSIAVPIHAGQRGHPVLFASPHFPSLRQLSGDTGGGVLLKANPDAVLRVPATHPGVLIDVDTPSALAEAEAYARTNSE